MNAKEAIAQLDNLRRAVLTVAGPNGPTALNGNDHDILRQCIDVLRLELGPPAPPPLEPSAARPVKPAAS